MDILVMSKGYATDYYPRRGATADCVHTKAHKAAKPTTWIKVRHIDQYNADDIHNIGYNNGNM